MPDDTKLTLESRVSALSVAVGNRVRTIIGNIGDLTNLTTTEKSNLVSALNELKTSVGALISDETTATTTTWSSTKIDSAITAAIEGLVNSAPGTLDTLKELADALGNDASFATTVANQIAAKADDTAVVKLTGDQTVAGVKTFSSAPVVSATIAADDDSTKVATTSWVNAKITGVTYEVVPTAEVTEDVETLLPIPSDLFVDNSDF